MICNNLPYSNNVQFASFMQTNQHSVSMCKLLFYINNNLRRLYV